MRLFGEIKLEYLQPSAVLTVMTVIVIGGLGLTHLLFSILSSKHPREFSEIGSPHLVLNNTPGNNFKFLRFLYLGEFRKLSSIAISSICYLICVLHVGLLSCLVAYPLLLRN